MKIKWYIIFINTLTIMMSGVVIWFGIRMWKVNAPSLTGVCIGMLGAIWLFRLLIKEDDNEFMED
ncbi:hypothetical protein QUF55_08505 [Clostridiaceae bacterium HSG29]|nr:hypothetical protein [Clostridiaceae bacterium HSG29]